MLREIQGLLLGMIGMAASGSTLNVDIEPVACPSGACIQITVVNSTKSNLCVSDTVLPSRGVLLEDALTITVNGNPNRMRFTGIEPASVSSVKTAQLVRLMTPGARAVSKIDLNEHYELTSRVKLMITYEAAAYPCGQYKDSSRRVLLGGYLQDSDLGDLQ